ncbi:MAG: carbonic anhydrase family protein [Deltaproteobacteria bacterium]|jgi:carbonic anhydrase|nr:carbonic anhydrase family protein [Deltaproteobacteria bacterium]MBW2495844.1 carbonic anhydrase family protein [Deltaproteobacteria bacterium]
MHHENLDLTTSLKASLLLFVLIPGLVACASDGSAPAMAGSRQDATQNGRAQSPIDLPSHGMAYPNGHSVALHYGSTAEHIIHRDHTLELKYDAGSSLEYDGRSFALEQVHFHTPSEHLVAGQRYPVELHLVHHDAEDRVLVVGILFQTGAKSEFLEEILQNAPEEIGRIDRDQTMSVKDLFPDESHFYAYEGSFTTPPYTEGVQWLVLKSHPQVSAEQVVELLVLEGGNAREIQRRHRRAVEDF